VLSKDGADLNLNKFQKLYRQLIGVLPPGLGIHIDTKTCASLRSFCFVPADCCGYPTVTCL